MLRYALHKIGVSCATTAASEVRPDWCALWSLCAAEAKGRARCLQCEREECSGIVYRVLHHNVAPSDQPKRWKVVKPSACTRELRSSEKSRRPRVALMGSGWVSP